ncbi:helix-turn-helix transcriptional regulator [Streptomyces sp. NPDC007088]|uniref:PadR family transcriptional regulator n=1 Tax=Streptomyces sp. NPDC007088 TaxID=3364773 RepID=UPI00369D3786
MPPVFAHGRLRLYLLKLLDEAPRHGYEVIRLLEERFQGLYAPSAGTVYPRLAKLESEGLVTHTTEGGRKVYSITEAGRAELADRGGELADLELEIRESVAGLAAEIRDDVRGAAGDLRREMRAAASRARAGAEADQGRGPSAAEKDAWRTAREELRRAKQEWKEQARRAKDESRRAREEAQRARRQAKEAQDSARLQAEEAQERLRRVARQVQEQVSRGDWPTGLREGLSELSKEFGRFDKGQGGGLGAWSDWSDWAAGRPASHTTHSPSPEPPAASGGSPAATPAPNLRKDTPAGGAVRAGEDPAVPGEGGPSGELPEWARRESASDDPARDLERLLDRFRDDVRDAARDHGVTEDQLHEVRHRLGTAAAHIGALLRGAAR